VTIHLVMYLGSIHVIAGMANLWVLALCGGRGVGVVSGWVSLSWGVVGFTHVGGGAMGEWGVSGSWGGGVRAFFVLGGGQHVGLSVVGGRQMYGGLGMCGAVRAL